MPKLPSPHHLIFVGSTNPVKIQAVTLAVAGLRQCQVNGIEVASGIPEQPLTDAVTCRGARTRARHVWLAGKKKLHGELDKQTVQNPRILGVGLEGGVFCRGPELWSTVWAAVTEDGTHVFESNGARFRLPEILAKPILAGEEMGSVLSRLFNGADIKRQNGGIGVMTNNYVTRTEEYSSIAKLAIGLWYGQDWQRGLTK